MVKLLVRCNNFCIKILKKQNTLRSCKKKKTLQFFGKIRLLLFLSSHFTIICTVQCTYYRHLKIHNQNQILENNLENWLYFFKFEQRNVI